MELRKLWQPAKLFDECKEHVFVYSISMTPNELGRTCRLCNRRERFLVDDDIYTQLIEWLKLVEDEYQERAKNAILAEIARGVRPEVSIGKILWLDRVGYE